MKRITFKFYHNFNGTFLGTMQFPYDKEKSIVGHYSRFWKKVRKGLGKLYKIEPRHVRAKILIH